MNCEATAAAKKLLGGGRCQNPGAVNRQLTGKLAAARAVLCKWHAGAFTRRGYKVERVNEANSSKDETQAATAG